MPSVGRSQRGSRRFDNGGVKIVTRRSSRLFSSVASHMKDRRPVRVGVDSRVRCKGSVAVIVMILPVAERRGIECLSGLVIVRTREGGAS